MNFGMIFLCLLMGAIVGYEVGKYTVSKRIGEMIKEFADNLKKQAEEAQKKKENEKKEYVERWKLLLKSWPDISKACNVNNAGDTDGDDNLTWCHESEEDEE